MCECVWWKIRAYRWPSVRIWHAIGASFTSGCLMAAAQAEDTSPQTRIPCSQKADDAATPTTLKVQYFGTSTLLITDGKTAIMTDGFFSRPSKMAVLFGRIGPDGRRIHEALEQAISRQVDLVLVGHSHFDHALDASVVAARTNARLSGSRSTRNIALASGLPAADTLDPARATVFTKGETITCGAFRIKVFASEHSPQPWLLARVLKGDVSGRFSVPANSWAYKEGGSFAFLIEHGQTRLLVVPSANDMEKQFPGVTADVVFLAIGFLGKQTEDFVATYWRESVAQTQAKLVVPVHWDDFTLPLAHPLHDFPSPFDNVERARCLISKLAVGKVGMRYLQAFETFDLPPGAPAAPPPSAAAEVTCPSK